MMEDFADQEWISLHAASELLGVAPSTVRRWGDAGRIPVKRTMGGHRRFSRMCVERLAHELEASSTPVESASTNHWWIDPRELMNQEWHAHFAGHAVSGRMRGLGQRLLGMLMQYINRRDAAPQLLQEAREVGYVYGTEASQLDLTMVDVVEAFLYFRRAFARLARPQALTEPPHIHEIITVRTRLDQFMDEILLGTIAGFEAGKHDIAAQRGI